MARIALYASASPAGMLDWAARHITGPGRDGRWCVVVPRAHLLRDLSERILVHSGRDAWLGTRAMTTDELLAHYARSLGAQPVLTPLQVRQIVQSIIRALHQETDGHYFRGQVFDERVSDATLRSLTRLFAEIEPYQYTAEDLREALEDGPTSDSLSQRAEEVTETYARYLARIEAHDFLAPLGFEIRAAEQAQHVPPPPGVKRLLFLGLDGFGPRDHALRLAYAMRGSADVEEVWLGLTLPHDPTHNAWGHHGNELIVHDFDAQGGARINLDPALGGRPPDLAALADDPFAYGRPPVPATGAVRGVRLPDTHLELRWVAADIKRRILAGDVRPEQIAIVDRRMPARAAEVEQMLARYGVPSVASRELPVSDVPAVRALLALFRLGARGWRPVDLIAVAESPYLPTDLHPTLLGRIGAAGTLPTSAEDWRTRVETFAQQAEHETGHPGERGLPADTPDAARALTDGFATFLDAYERVLGSRARTARAWVDTLLAVVEAWKLGESICATNALIDRASRGRLARNDLDGVNALLRSAHDWLRGREIAGYPNDVPLSLRQWYTELEAVARETIVRSSTYPREAVHLLDPRQAALRSWPVVYIIGLTDGYMPSHADPEEYALSEEERRALLLPTTEQRAASERLLFHLAVATAEQELVLTTAAADDRGKALVTSPFIACMPLRLAGFTLDTVPARAMTPATPADVLTPEDLDLLAAEHHRAALEGAGVGAGTEPAAAAAADPNGPSGPNGESTAAAEPGAAPLDPSDALLHLWLSRPAASRAIRAWRIEHARLLGPEALLAEHHALGRHLGILPPEHVPADVASEQAAFSPSELQLVQSCQFRFFGTRLLGLRKDDDEDHNEAAAFGSLQHQILEDLYRELDADGLLPPRRAADVVHALARLDVLAADAVRRFTASAHDRLWDLDLEFVLDLLAAFVRRDLYGMLQGSDTPGSVRLRTEIAGLEVRVGYPEPIRIEHAGHRFRLRGKIDRVERIQDERLPDEAQGWLLIRDYKGTRNPWAPRVERYMRGEHLQLPLYARMAEEHFGARAFGFGELRTSQPADPEPVLVREVRATGSGVTLQPPSAGHNPVGASIRASLDVAGELIGRIRAGHFFPQADRACWGCHLSTVCRASRIQNPAAMRQRAQMPLAVSIDEFNAASQGSPDA